MFITTVVESPLTLDSVFYDITREIIVNVYKVGTGKYREGMIINTKHRLDNKRIIQAKEKVVKALDTYIFTIEMFNGEFYKTKYFDMGEKEVSYRTLEELDINLD